MRYRCEEPQHKSSKKHWKCRMGLHDWGVKCPFLHRCRRCGKPYMVIG